VAISSFDVELDLTKREHGRTYQDGASALPFIFTGLAKDLNNFISTLSSRAQKCNWGTTILSIPVGNERYDLLKNYGVIPIGTIKNNLAKAKAKGASNSGGSSRSRGRSGHEWKFDPSLGTNGVHSHSSKGRTPKTYKWCAGPGHGGKAMWVCGHEPGPCTENYERPNQGGNNQRSNQGGHSNSGSSGHTTNAGDTNSIQALRAVLENANFGDDASAQLQACLALLQS
jgi:hypothetical protein